MAARPALPPFFPHAHANSEPASPAASPSPPQNRAASGRDLASFRPAFRVEWLIALKHEVLRGMLDEFNKLRVDVHGALTEMGTDLKAVLSMVQYGNERLSEEVQKSARASQEEQLTMIAQKHDVLRQDFAQAVAGGVKVAFPDPPDVAGPMRRVVKEMRMDVVREVTKELRAETRTVLQEVGGLRSSVEEKMSRELDELHEGSTQLQSSVAALASHLREQDEESTSMLDELTKTRSDLQARIADLSERSFSERVPLELQSKLADFVERPPLDLQPLLAAVEQLRHSTPKVEDFDLSPVLSAVGHVEAAQKGGIAALQSSVQQLQRAAEEQQPPLPAPDVDLEPVLTAIAAIDLNSLAEDFATLRRLGDASLEAIAALDLESLHSAVIASDQRHESRHEDVLEKLQAIEAKPAPSPVDLSPVLKAVAADTTAVIQRIDAFQHAATTQSKAAAMEAGSVLVAVKKVDSKLDSFDTGAIMAAIHKTGRGLQDANNEILTLASNIDSKPAVDLSPLVDAIKKVDAKPPVNLAPVCERIRKVEDYMAQELGTKLDKVDPAITEVRKALDRIQGSLPVDQRPTLQALSRIEQMLPVDLRPVLDIAMRIDSKPPPDLEPLHLSLKEASEALKEVMDELVPASTKRVLDALDKTDDQQQTLLHKLVTITSRIDRRPDQDLSPVIGCVARVGAKIDNLPPLDLDPVLEQLSITQAKIDELPPPPDLAPVLEEASRAAAHLQDEMHAGLSPILEVVLRADSKLPQDLGAVLAAIDAVDGKTAEKITAVLDLLKKVDDKPPVDLNPVLKSVEKCETGLKKHLGPPVTQIKGDATTLVSLVKELMGRKDRNIMWKTPSAVW